MILGNQYENLQQQLQRMLQLYLNHLVEVLHDLVKCEKLLHRELSNPLLGEVQMLLKGLCQMGDRIVE